MRKKCIILTVFLSLVLLISYNASADDPVKKAPVKLPPAKYITGPQLEQLMKDGKQLAIIDIRDRGYYKQGHIPGAINVPSDEAYNKRDIVEEYKPTDRIVIVGYGGTTGQEIIDKFLKQKYLNIYGLTGGMEEWKGALKKGPK